MLAEDGLAGTRRESTSSTCSRRRHSLAPLYLGDNQNINLGGSTTDNVANAINNSSQADMRAFYEGVCFTADRAGAVKDTPAKGRQGSISASSLYKYDVDVGLLSLDTPVFFNDQDTPSTLAAAPHVDRDILPFPSGAYAQQQQQHYQEQQQELYLQQAVRVTPEARRFSIRHRHTSI